MAATQVDTYQVHAQAGGLGPGRFVQVLNGNGRLWGSAEFLIGKVTPYHGVVPDGADVFPVDPKQDALTSAATAAAAAAAAAPKPKLRLPALKKRYNWARDSQATEALDRLGFPIGKIVTVEERAWTGGMEISKHQEWTAEELDAYDEVLARVFPNAIKR